MAELRIALNSQLVLYVIIIVIMIVIIIILSIRIKFWGTLKHTSRVQTYAAGPTLRWIVELRTMGDSGNVTERQKALREFAESLRPLIKFYKMVLPRFRVDPL